MNAEDSNYSGITIEWSSFIRSKTILVLSFQSFHVLLHKMKEHIQTSLEQYNQ